MPHAADRLLLAVKPITVPTTRPDEAVDRSADATVDAAAARDVAAGTDRGTDLQVKVTAPADGQDLPVIVFSHGNAWSMDAYEPLVDRWAGAGFVVVQPTHLDSRRHGIGLEDPRFATIWRLRIADLHAVLDHLPTVLGRVEGLLPRVNLARVAVVGHSWGGQSAGALLGARVLAPAGDPEEDFSHPLVRAGALIATTGTGQSLTPFAQEHLPFMRPDYSTMTTPTLVVAGGRDRSALSTRGPDWFTDAHRLSPPPQRLLIITDGEHTLGGLAGEAVLETSDEDPARVALVADAVSAHLLDVLTADSTGWHELLARAADGSGTFTVESS